MGCLPFSYQFVTRVAVVTVLPTYTLTRTCVQPQASPFFSLSLSLLPHFFPLCIGEFLFLNSVSDTTISLYDSLKVWRISRSTVWRCVHHSGAQ